MSTKAVTDWIRANRRALASPVRPEQVRALHRLARALAGAPPGDAVEIAEASMLDLGALDGPLERPGTLVGEALRGAGLGPEALHGEGEDPIRAALAGLGAVLIAKGVVGGGVPAKAEVLATISGLAGARRRWRQSA